MFRAALVSVVLTLAIGPNAGLLCTVWCLDATSTGCPHQDSTTSPSVRADDTCNEVAVGAVAFVREDGRRIAPAPDSQNALVVIRFRFVAPPIDPRPGYESGRRVLSRNDLSPSPSESKSLRRSRLRGRALRRRRNHTTGALRVRIAQARQTQIRCDFGHQRGRSVMRTVHFRSLSIAAVAVVTFAGNVAAQEKPSGLLNTLEVQQLVKRAEPGDNARLAAHFTALAERYVAEAKRHTSMAQSFVGNPSRNLGTGMSAHCKQLADLNMKSATELRELATYHPETGRLVP